MSTLYLYIFPVTLLALSFGLSVLLNNELIFGVGLFISLASLVVVASTLKNKLLIIVSSTLLTILIIYTLLILFWANQW